MPGLASYAKKLRSSGLVVLGVARKSTKEAALEVARNAGVDFPIIDGGTLPGVEEMKIPQYTVYDHNGEIVYRQTEPFEADAGMSPECRAAIDRALSEAGPRLDVSPSDFQEKEIVKLAKRAVKGVALGKVLSELDSKITEGSDGEKAEGERLRDQIIAHGERVLADGEAIRESKPHRHFDLLKDLAKQYRGHDIGNKADSTLETIKRDKAAMREVEASRLYEAMTLAPERDRKKIYGTLKKKYAQTRFAKMAADELGEELPAPDDVTGRDEQNGGKDTRDKDKDKDKDDDDEEDD